MSKNGKRILGFLTFLPIFLMILYVILMINMFSTVVSFDPENFQEDNPALVFTQMVPLMVVALLMGISALGLMIFYIIHVAKNEEVDSTERIVWIVVFIFAGIIGMPVYWYLRIWPSPPLTTEQKVEQEPEMV